MSSVENGSGKTSGKHGSVVTIFSLWNTMLGPSLLSMPWAIGQAGFSLGIGLSIFMAAITLYTAYIVAKKAEEMEHKEDKVLDYTELCEYYLGRPGRMLSVIFSVTILLGVVVVRWVIVSNFLFNTVVFTYEEVSGQEMMKSTSNSVTLFNDEFITCKQTMMSSGDMMVLSNDSVVQNPSMEIIDTMDTFHSYWDLTKTVPFFVMILVVPLINFKSATFFNKFNALGAISGIYLIGFITYKASLWGFHLNFDGAFGKHASLSFPTLTGVLSLAFLIHNPLLSILSNQEKPENNGRDLTIAFVFVSATYIYIGTIIYAAWPLESKDCINQNLLDNLLSNDPTAFIARMFLLLQTITSFPLFFYIIRVQIMTTLFSSVWPSWKHVIVLNVLIVGICLTFATLYPEIGTILRYTGSFCGLVVIFLIPCLIYIVSQKRKGELTVFQVIVHAFIMSVGVANAIGQLFV